MWYLFEADTELAHIVAIPVRVSRVAHNRTRMVSYGIDRFVCVPR